MKVNCGRSVEKSSSCWLIRVATTTTSRPLLLVLLAFSPFAQPANGYVTPPPGVRESGAARLTSASIGLKKLSFSTRQSPFQQQQQKHQLQPLYTSTADSTTNQSTSNSGNSNGSNFHTKYYIPTKLNSKHNHDDDIDAADELSWLVLTTAKLIGQTARPVGSLDKSMIFQTHRAMREWSRRSSKPNSNAPHVVEQLLHRLIQEQHAGNPYVVIDTRIYNVVIEAWSRSRQDGAAKRAEEILIGMVKQYHESQNNADGNETDDIVKPNRASFNNVIKSWVRNTKNMKDAVRKVESLINRMAELSHQDTSDGADRFQSPCRRGYNLLLYAYAHSRLPNAGERSESILREMERAGATDDAVAPDTNSYNLVIKSWAQGAIGTSRGFEHRAQAIFDQVLQIQKDDASGGKSPLDGIQPNDETFNAILSCWLKSKDNGALNQVTMLLETMERMYKENNNRAAVKPGRVTMNSVMTALCRSGELERAVQLQNRMEEVYGIIPDTVSNNILIDGWSKSERTEAPERALDILLRMEETFKAGGNNARHVKPDNYSYTSCIDCFVKSNRPRAGQHAIRLLARMKKLHRDFGGEPPSTDCYNAVLNGLAAARNKDSADLAMSILTEMEEKSAISSSLQDDMSDDINHGSSSASGKTVLPKPNRVTYNTCLKACRNGHDEYALIAEQLLDRMAEAAEEGNNPSLAPDSYTYAAVINVLGRSDNIDKAERVLRILNQMIAAYQAAITAAAADGSQGKSRPPAGLKPSLHVFNAALNACAFSRYDINAKMDAFVITVSILVLLQQYVTADEVTYGTVLRACSNLLPRSDPRRDDLVGKIFGKARQEGHVSDMVLTQLKFAASAPLLQELVGIHKDLEVTMEDLPKDWTRRVKRRRIVNRWTY